ncbi:MAG: 30S ribosomal protein S6 [Deltaproteobacteria bacterium]|nr:30S ribosomal protein S6 [Deltaproteobacteria bacterium]MBW2015680.1 30S ribosomal protein S6 [Deltaproteobacteria bacterium]
MRHYETIYILNPNLADEQYQEARDKFGKIIEREKGVLIRTEEWGTQKLAYNVKKFERGTYVLVEYCGNPGLTAELERELKLDDRILLYQTVKLSDKADPEALLLREEEARKARETKETESAAEVKTDEEGGDKTEAEEKADSSSQGGVSDGVQ